MKQLEDVLKYAVRVDVKLIPYPTPATIDYEIITDLGSMESLALDVSINRMLELAFKNGMVF